MNTFEKGILLYNVRAGAVQIEEKLAAVLPPLAKMVKELTSVRPESEEETRDICMRSGDYNVFIILGGDGTIHQCINVIAKLDRRPAIAILPGGTSNDFSRTLGMSQNLHEAAQSLTTCTLKKIDVGKTGERHFTNFWGIGLVAETSQNIDSEQKKNFGPLSYMASTVRTLKQAQTFPFELEANGKHIAGEAIAIFVLNGFSLATTRIPIAGISPTDGKLDLLVFRASNLAALRELFSLRKEDTTNEQLDMLEYVQVDQLHISAPSQTHVDMDGELYQFQEGTIQVLPGHLEILVPCTEQ